MNILVIAAHPDDEVLGMGATIKKLTKKGHRVTLCVVSEGATAQYDNKKMIEIRQNSCIKSGKILGISNFEFLNFPDMKLDSVSHLELNRSLEKIVKKYKPTIVYTTHHDLNKDHQIVFESTLVVTRPFKSSVKQILSYEIPGSNKSPFSPNYFENVDKEYLFKIKAFKKYESEIESFPHPRSFEFLDSLSKLRGVESGLSRAEAFQIIKFISN